MKSTPSDLFLGAILRGYDAEARSGKSVTASSIWDHICCEAIQQSGMFTRLFEWDTRKAPQNRIGTIRDCIAEGLVPGLTVGCDAKGRAIVVAIR